MNHTHICNIIPPYIIKNILERGSPIQKQQAVKVLEHSTIIRSQRRNLDVGEIIHFPASEVRKQRLIYDAGFNTDLPGRLIMSEGDISTADIAINEAYEGSGKTFDLFYDIFGRNSIDNNGMNMISTVHYAKGYDNAFWNGEQMIYGDGDEDLPEEDRLFNRFTIALDVIGHELTHGVTQYEARLDYYGQPGALNESFSDVFGALVKQHTLNQTAEEADWLIGKGLFTKNVKGEGIRSLKAPGTAYDDPVLGKDPQPGHMINYVETSSDNGGVHINSGIPNKAFYICALDIGGYAWEKAGRIWYHTLKNKLVSTSGFQDAANSTYQSARELYGDGSPEQSSVKKGWADAGIFIEEESNVC